MHRPSDVDTRRLDAFGRHSPSSPLEAPGAACRAGWPLLFLPMLACGPTPEVLQEALARCEPLKPAVMSVWHGDRRAPCGERWLLDNAPTSKPPDTPLGNARRVMRSILTGEPLQPGDSLWLREDGLPRDVAATHLNLLAEGETPEGLDPWITARIGVERENREAAARLVAWSAWDPQVDRRQQTLEQVSRLFEVDVVCTEPQCLWEFADSLEAPSGVPGSREAGWDAVWLAETRDARLTGLAGGWVMAWKSWVREDPARDPARWGVERDPARALWSGGTPEAQAALRGELGLGPTLVPPVTAVPSDTPGGRAAALIPW